VNVANQETEAKNRRGKYSGFEVEIFKWASVLLRMIEIFFQFK